VLMQAWSMHAISLITMQVAGMHVAGIDVAGMTAAVARCQSEQVAWHGMAQPPDFCWHRMEDMLYMALLEAIQKSKP